MRAIVIIPTYNEGGNIARTADKVFQFCPECDILVVDDNSNDGTREEVERLSRRYPGKVFLLPRSRKMGLGTAYLDGFAYAMGKGYDYMLEMDADLSHDPADIPRFLELMKEADVVVGSRYIGGIRIINWPMRRLLLSYFAGVYCRALTGLELSDCTGGFKCFSRKALEAIPLKEVRSDGYAFQIEMNWLAVRRGLKVAELPIVFTERRDGQSKMSSAIVREAVLLGLRLFFRRLFSRSGAVSA